MIEIKHRYNGTVLYTAESATDVRTALEKAVKADANLAGADLADANLADANLAGAYLADAYLARADLAGADLAGAYLARANLADADLARADLAGANLAGADLAGADLADAYLAHANLAGAKGIQPERVNDLLFLLDQPGKIRAYKLVTASGNGPFTGGIIYEEGESYEVDDADTDSDRQCGRGINLATLPWCLKNWAPGYRILIAEFKAKDIAAIPVGDGKFRVHRCKIVGEKDISELVA